MGFYIGRIYGFKWGERPFHGKMSEVRVWSVARTENQLKQNMLGVDPASEGLALYYKLDGFGDSGRWSYQRCHRAYKRYYKWNYY